MPTLTGLQVGSTVTSKDSFGTVYTVTEIDPMGHAIEVSWVNTSGNLRLSRSSAGFFKDSLGMWDITYPRKTKRKVM